MNKTQTIIGVIAVIALLVGIWAKVTPATTMSTSPFGAVSNTNGPAAGSILANGTLLPNPSVLDYFIARTFLYADKAIGYGNSSGTPILQQGSRQLIVPSSNIVCSLQNPNTTATSTFEFSTNISSTSANAGTLILATASSATATTTTVGSISLAANAQLTFATQGTTSSQVAGEVGPSKFLNLGGVTGADTMLNQLGGSCDVIWTSTN